MEVFALDGFKNIQLDGRLDSLSSAVKNYACQGGTRFGNITNITQSSPAVVTFEKAVPFRDTKHFGQEFKDIVGMTELNLDGNEYFIKTISETQAEIYLDADRTIPLDTTSFNAYVSGGQMFGFYGTRQIITFLWKPFDNLGVDQVIRVRLNWRELKQ